MAERRSVCEYFYQPKGLEGHKCGYCKSKDTSISQGMWTHCLTVDDYQALIDRGWRRSGKYCYKPLMSKTCCPLYTISCVATKFRISKSQKGVLKKMGKYLVDGLEQKEGGGGGRVQGSRGATTSASSAAIPKRPVKPVKPGEGADLSKPPCRKAKILRKERKEGRMHARAGGVGTEEGGMEDDGRVGVKEEGEGPKGKEAAGTVGGKEAQKATSSAVADLTRVGSDGKKPLEAFLPLPTPSKPGAPNAHSLEIKLIKSSPPSEEFTATFAESYALFKKYQMSIHKEAESDCKESGYRRFLCDSPLIPRQGKEGWPCGYGSYHQHYRVDGKLIAVGVIDILPKCLSSVYLYYDPDYEFLNLGVYSALRETEFVRRLHPGDPENFKYYYMGYYIHSCQKMRYKGNYTPSYLLCPESYRFVRIEDCVPKLDVSKYSRFSSDEPAAGEDAGRAMSEALVLVDRSFMKYGQFCGFVPAELRQTEKVRQYVELVGANTASRMLLVMAGN